MTRAGPGRRGRRGAGVAVLGMLTLLGSGAAVVTAEDGGGAAADPIERRAARWTGTYRHVGGEADQQARNHAIDRATDGMMFIARSIARSRLRDATQPYEALTIQVTGTEVTIETDVRWTTPIDGTSRRRVDAKGDAYRVSTRFDGDRLVQTIRDDALRNVNTFRLSSDGQRMRMHVRVDHDRLAGTVDYSLRYRRE